MLQAVSSAVGFLPSSPITSGDNINCKLPKAMLNAIVVYVPEISSDGLWAWALVMTE